jgi:hypothetical protein
MFRTRAKEMMYPPAAKNEAAIENLRQILRASRIGISPVGSNANPAQLARFPRGLLYLPFA